MINKQTFQIPVELTVKARQEAEIPVAITLDLTKELHKLGYTGIVDEHSIRLKVVNQRSVTGNDRSHIEIPVQFSSVVHERGRRDRTEPAEYDCADTIGYAGTSAGVLTWMLQPEAEDKAEAGQRQGQNNKRMFLVEFDVPREGRAVEVPFPPYNRVVFTPEGAISPLQPNRFPHVELGPHYASDNKLHIVIDQKLLTTYQYAEPSKRPFWYPLIGPAGVSITDVGKPHDPSDSHKHHYSLWIGNKDVDGVDFWGDHGPGLGEIKHQSFDLIESGPVFGKMIARSTWEQAGDVLLDETRTCTFYRTNGTCQLMDISIMLTPRRETCIIGKSLFGFLAVRVKESMTPFDGGGEIRNSRGGLNEKAVIWRKAEWCDIAGPALPGRWNGIAIMDHPSNPRYPVSWHCRNDGWICTSFTLEEPYVIKQASPLMLTYRVLVHEGNAIQGRVAQMYADYINTVQTEIGMIQES